MRRICLDLLHEVSMGRDPDEAMEEFLGCTRWRMTQLIENLEAIETGCARHVELIQQMNQLIEEILAGLSDRVNELLPKSTIESVKELQRQWIYMGEELRNQILSLADYSPSHQKQIPAARPESIPERLAKEIHALLEELCGLQLHLHAASSPPQEQITLLQFASDQLSKLRLGKMRAFTQQMKAILKQQLQSDEPVRRLLKEFREGIDPSLYNRARRLQALFFMSHRLVMPRGLAHLEL